MQLIVQATQYALGTAAVVVLHKRHAQPSSLCEVLFVEAFEEEPTGIPKHFRLQQQYFGD